MQAVVNYGAGDLRLEDIPVPTVRDGQVLLKVLACGICGGEYKLAKQGGEPAAVGIIPGHEVIGEIVESPTDALPPGMRVAISPNYSCGLCDGCRSGHLYLCSNRPKRTAEIGGGYAEYALVYPSQCYALPDHLDTLSAAITETLACCLHGAEKVNIQAGERVIIIGAGANAQLFVQIARIRGASFVMVVDNLQDRMDMALSLGADAAVDPSQQDPLDVLPYGADVVIVNRGRAEAVTDAVNWCASSGRVLCYGVPGAGIPTPVEPHLLWKKEVSIVGSRSYGTAFGASLALIASGRIQVKPIITRTVPVSGAIEALRSPQASIKTVIVP
jgi:L-iditol 2-dehydrogenase